ncbi:MAG: isoprenylcysteine carboxylmethyltransferase family protein [Candidatus Micrarchaeota archaeon]
MKRGITPPTYFVALLLFSVGSHVVVPIKEIIQPPYTYSGGMLIAFGILLNIWADTLFKKMGTTVKPHENPSRLITQGPFRISRHPMYLGMASILLGVAVLLGSVITFACPIIFVVVMERMFIPHEEKNIERIFEKEYLKYKRKVRRWI